MLSEKDKIKQYKDDVSLGLKIAKKSHKLLKSNVKKPLPNNYLDECLNRAWSSTNGGLKPVEGADLIAYDLSERIKVLVRWIKGNVHSRKQNKKNYERIKKHLSSKSICECKGKSSEYEKFKNRCDGCRKKLW